MTSPFRRRRTARERSDASRSSRASGISCTEPVHGVSACARTMPPAAKFMEPGLCSTCSSSWTEAVFGERQFME